MKTSINAIRRSPFQAMAAISALSITFLVTTLLSLLILASHNFVRYVETRPQVIVFMNLDATSEDTNSLLEIIKNDTRVTDVTYITKEDALNIYKDATSDNPLLGDLVSPSIFPESIEFSLLDLNNAENIISEIEGNTFVDSVSFTASVGSGQSSEAINRLKNITYYIRLGGVVSVSILLLNSFLVLVVVIGMRITMKRSEVEILSLIGANNWFIKSPIILESLIYSILGCVIGWGISFVLALYSIPSLLKFFGEIEILPRDPVYFILLMFIILGIEILIGIIISLLGSLLAVSRSIKVK